MTTRVFTLRSPKCGDAFAAGYIMGSTPDCEPDGNAADGHGRQTTPEPPATVKTHLLPCSACGRCRGRRRRSRRDRRITRNRQRRGADSKNCQLRAHGEFLAYADEHALHEGQMPALERANLYFVSARAHADQV